MTLNTLHNVIRKVALGLAVTGATAFQAGGCSVNINGDDLMDLVDGVLTDAPGLEDGWEDPIEWEDPSCCPVDEEFPEFEEMPVDPSFSDYPGWF